MIYHRIPKGMLTRNDTRIITFSFPSNVFQHIIIDTLSTSMLEWKQISILCVLVQIHAWSFLQILCNKSLDWYYINTTHGNSNRALFYNNALKIEIYFLITFYYHNVSLLYRIFFYSFCYHFFGLGEIFYDISLYKLHLSKLCFNMHVSLTNVQGYKMISYLRIRWL